jgi:hypothetical protein
MKAVLVCPAERPALAALAQRRPLVTVPFLGLSLLDYWLQHLASLGATQATVVVADRAAAVAAHLGDGARWGIEVEVVKVDAEPTRAEAFSRYREDEPGRWLEAPNDLVFVDHLPALPKRRPLDSYADWFATARDFIPLALTPDRVGLREIEPGVWVGLRTRLAPTAKFTAPCWIGDDAYVGPHAQIGPNVILEDRVFIEAGAHVIDSIVGPDTFVGGVTEIRQSFAWGDQLINWRSGSTLRVAEDFLLCSIESQPRGFTPVAWWRRQAEALARALASPAGGLLRRDPIPPSPTPRPAGSRTPF